MTTVGARLKTIEEKNTPIRNYSEYKTISKQTTANKPLLFLFLNIFQQSEKSIQQCGISARDTITNP
jgi:hypothetical protein